jgi:hypothetical protein
MKGFSAIHTPSLAYDAGAFEIPGMLDFIASFAVVEDFAMQIRMAEARPGLRYAVERRFHVYYRRTHQSTYLVKNEAFVADKSRMYRHLAGHEANPVKRALVLNRIPCLRMGGAKKYLMNANTLVYMARVALLSPLIALRALMVRCPIGRYREHLALIRTRAAEFAAKTRAGSAPGARDAATTGAR